jgi:hypothetical protein
MSPEVLNQTKKLLSIMRKSKSPQLTYFKNCWIKPFFLGPLQMTASFWLLIRNAIDITAKFSKYTGDHPYALWWTYCPIIPSIVGTLGPQISTSRIPTSYFSAKHKANWVATVLLPTPPFPDKTKILCLIFLNFSLIIAMFGSIWTSPEEQADWFGQPWQAYDFPAEFDFTPGQC